jgi:hypothetical protein
MRGGDPVRHRMSSRRDTVDGQVDEAAKAEKSRREEVANATNANGGL